MILGPVESELCPDTDILHTVKWLSVVFFPQFPLGREISYTQTGNIFNSPSIPLPSSAFISSKIYLTAHTMAWSSHIVQPGGT